MEKNLKSVVIRMKSPVSRLEKKLIKPVSKLDKELISVDQRLDNTSFENYNSFIKNTNSYSKETSIKNFKRIKSRDLYKDTILKDYSKPLSREEKRMKLNVEVNQIIKNKTVISETNDRYIKEFLLNQCQKWFQIRILSYLLKVVRELGRQLSLKHLLRNIIYKL